MTKAEIEAMLVSMFERIQEKSHQRIDTREFVGLHDIRAIFNRQLKNLQEKEVQGERSEG